VVLTQAARFLVTPTVFLCSFFVARVDSNLGIFTWLLLLPAFAVVEALVSSLAERAD
jgi:hypothetical protein